MILFSIDESQFRPGDGRPAVATGLACSQPVSRFQPFPRRTGSHVSVPMRRVVAGPESHLPESATPPNRSPITPTQHHIGIPER